MSQQYINIGYVVNDGTGDDLRTSFDKVNTNFTEIYDAVINGTVEATPNTIVRRDANGGGKFLKLLWKNEYGSPANFPLAVDHAGMVAFANSTGRAYYSDGAQWKLIASGTSTDDFPEGAINKYFTNDRARNAISVEGAGYITYNPVTGVIVAAALTAADVSGVASTAYVDAQVTAAKSEILDGVSTNLDTLKELAEAINNDPDFFSTVASGLSSKADAADVYTKTEIDTNIYNKTEVDSALADKANSADVYTKTEIDTALADKANVADVYNKTEVYTQLQVDTLIASALSGAETYATKTELWNLLLNISNRLNEAGIPDILGSLTADSVVNEDWGSIMDDFEMPEDYGNSLADDNIY